jgi:hypothetical protein
MSRASMAFRCFFRLLFGGTLPAEAVAYLPKAEDAEARPTLPRPDAGPAPSAERTAKPGQKSMPAEAAELVEDVPARGEIKPEAKADAKRAPARKDATQQHTEGALAFLALLQREGRLVDFLQESLDGYDDGDIGASVRDIHRGLRKVLGDYFTIEPVMPGEEDDRVSVPKGFDPGEVRLVGDVTGQPPFQGVLRHHGWRVTKVTLPTLSEGVDRHVLAPAEVEIS